MNIGEVVTFLEAEFPEVTVSKLRFLESEGLVQPLRSTSGYRRYGEVDVARITRLLRLQRDQHLPLKVIAGLLDQPEPTDEVDGLVPAFRDSVGRRGRMTGQIDALARIDAERKRVTRIVEPGKLLRVNGG